MPRRRREAVTAPTINRRIFFYRIDAGVHPDTGQPRQIRFGHVVTQLAALPFRAGTNGRYLDGDGKQTCLWADNNESPYRIKLAHIRRSQHPPVEIHGNFTKLELERGGGLAEITHLVIFPRGIVGAEFNFYGPRASQLSVYIGSKLAGIVPTFRLLPLVRPDLEQALAALDDITLLDLKARASFAGP